MNRRAQTAIVVAALLLGIGAGILATSLIEPPRHLHFATRGDSIADQGGVLEIKSE